MVVYAYNTYLNDSGVPYLEKEKGFRIDGRRKFCHPDDIVEFICQIGIQRCADEHTYILCLDTSNHIIGCFEVSHGTVDAAIISPREIFQKALLIGATSIIMTHNHPSSDVTPSYEDKGVTKRIKEAGELLNVKLLDHIIVGRDSYYSFKGNNEI